MLLHAPGQTWHLPSRLGQQNISLIIAVSLLQKSEIGELPPAGKTALAQLASYRQHHHHRASAGNVARDSLAHISVNLPEAPAFRHVPLTHSPSSRHHKPSAAGPPREDVLGLSPLLMSYAGHVDLNSTAQRLGGKSRRSSIGNGVTVSLPDSPKRKVVKQHSLHQAASSEPFEQAGSDPGPNRYSTATAEASQPGEEGQLHSSHQLTGLFGNVSLEPGPPRLSAAASDRSQNSSCQHKTVAADDTAEANAVDRALLSQKAVLSSTVEFPLRQSDFSR